MYENKLRRKKIAVKIFQDLNDIKTIYVQMEGKTSKLPTKPRNYSQYFLYVRNV